MLDTFFGVNDNETMSHCLLHTGDLFSRTTIVWLTGLPSIPAHNVDDKIVPIRSELVVCGQAEARQIASTRDANIR